MAWYPEAIRRPIVNQPVKYTVSGPQRIIHHTTEGRTAASAFAAYKASGNDPHFTVHGKTVYQHYDTAVGSRALRNAPGGVETNSSGAIQIELVGFAGQPKDRESLTTLRDLLRWLEKTHKIPADWPAGPPKPAKDGRDPGGHNRRTIHWSKKGHFGHSQAPENFHWDPAYTAEEFMFIMDPPKSLVPDLVLLFDDVDVTAAARPRQVDGENGKTTFVDGALRAIADAAGWKITFDAARNAINIRTR